MFELRLARVNHNADRPKLALYLEGHARPLPYVLQYRVLNDDGTPTGHLNWSEWRDVPTETEGGPK